MDQHLDYMPQKGRKKTPIIFVLSALLIFSGLAGLVMWVIGTIFGFAMSTRDILWGLFCTVVIPAYVICTNYRTEKS